MMSKNVSPHSPHRSGGMNPLSSTGTCICGNTAKKSVLEEDHEAYIQQLKEQFEGELERQQILHAHSLANNTSTASKIL